MFGVLDWLRRRRAERQPFPPAWRDILAREVPFYRRLDAGGRARFEDKLKVFALTKVFVPAGGMEIDEEVRVVIAASAARLSMNLPGEHFQRLTEVVVYPEDYRHTGHEGAILGEAHHWGTVVLSWAAVRAGLRDECDGHNTALHEFAHVLDIADGTFDGTPQLGGVGAYAPWARVMSEAFLALRAGRRGGRRAGGAGDRRARRARGARDARRPVLRSYGAVNEAEFFAVATEAFFEKPRQLREREPELYRVLAEYYRADPLAEGSGCPD